MGVSPTNLATERFWVLTITDEITHSNSINENHIETFWALETKVDSRNRHLCETVIHSQEERRFRPQQAGKSQEETEECMVRYHNPPPFHSQNKLAGPYFGFYQMKQNGKSGQKLTKEARLRNAEPMVCLRTGLRP